MGILLFLATLRIVKEKPPKLILVFEKSSIPYYLPVPYSHHLLCEVSSIIRWGLGLSFCANIGVSAKHIGFCEYYFYIIRPNPCSIWQGYSTRILLYFNAWNYLSVISGVAEKLLLQKDCMDQKFKTLSIHTQSDQRSES